MRYGMRLTNSGGASIVFTYMARTPEYGDGETVSALERYLSDESLVGPDSWNALTGWLTNRIHFLPLVGWDRSFIRLIAQMEPEDREGYLEDLPLGLLSSQEYDEWLRLTSDCKELIERMIGFWRMRRGL